MLTAFRTALLLSLLLVASCATVDANRRAKLIGTWQYADSHQQCRYSFKNDGTFSGFVRSEGELVADFTGRWALENGAILYRYGSDRFNRIPPGTADRDTILALVGDRLNILVADGSRREYVRVP